MKIKAFVIVLTLLASVAIMQAYEDSTSSNSNSNSHSDSDDGTLSVESISKSQSSSLSGDETSDRK